MKQDPKSISRKAGVKAPFKEFSAGARAGAGAGAGGIRFTTGPGLTRIGWTYSLSPTTFLVIFASIAMDETLRLMNNSLFFLFLFFCLRTERGNEEANLEGLKIKIGKISYISINLMFSDISTLSSRN
jgi:hypothetical protein